MMQEIRNIDFKKIESGFPAFITIIMMPLTYSIATGIMFGFLSYTLTKILAGKLKELNYVVMIIALMCLLNLIYGMG